ncbi:hypothetical protein L1987_35826 [Smallanthus sonchifolius]|uniref:Uncharacterized protein n=1 Tax=Smallanthus sonchifolius TaxID=185202 RepID=A0ACB9HD69_9ASTR|nr:hypothetical protein L1987_35826 [Smallanthus sonchifolius]
MEHTCSPRVEVPLRRETLDITALVKWLKWAFQERALDWGPGGGPDLIVDDGGDATLLIHEGVKVEEEFKKTRKLPDPTEYQIMLLIVKEWLQSDPKKYHKMKDKLVGVFEETTTGVKRLYQMQDNDTLLFPAITVNDSVTKSKQTISPPLVSATME